MALSSTPSLFNLEFATFLRQRRRDLDLTRTELARQVGCSPDTIKKLEEGERRPSKELAELLADHLQIERAMRSAFILMARSRSISNTDAGPSNLPAPLTSFIGRSTEVDVIESLLRARDVRLLTLMGPPGVGKSRLAIHIAERLRSHFADGVWFIPLAAIEDPQQALFVLANALGIAEEATGTPLDWLMDSLRHRNMLLVLDNFEQILDAAPYLTTLLSACAHLSALVTSRAPLEVYGEHRFVVQPLPVPPPASWHMPSELVQYEAIQLFVARVRAFNPTFRLVDDNSEAIAELCARLDGIPLAIELAAGLARAESTGLLLADIKHEGRLALLNSNQRDRTARQQTLREAIAWSVRRLSAFDQLLFARLSVFPGEFDLSAAQAVAGVAEDETTLLPPQEYAARLQALAESHLVQLHAGKDGPRYRLLETLREYATDALQTAGVTEAAQRRHAHYFTTLVLAIDPAETISNLHRWRDQLKPDYANLIAALQFALSKGDAQLTLGLAGGLGEYWYLEGSWQEGAQWLEQALDLPGGEQSLRTRALTELGILYSVLGRYPEAEAQLQLAREEAAEAGDLLTVARTLSQLSQTALLQGHVAITRAHTLERLQIYRQLGETRYLAITLEQIGCAAIEEGDYERGVPWLVECESLWAAQGARAGVAAARLIIGMAELAQGNAASALARFQQAYEEFNSIQHSHGIPWSLRNLGLAQIALGQLPQAQFSLYHAYERYAALTSHDGPVAVVVEAIAGIATRTGHHHLAAHLMGAASVSRQHGLLPITENSRQIYEKLLAPSVKALGQTAWDDAILVGTTLPWTEALASAVALLTPNALPQNKAPATP